MSRYLARLKALLAEKPLSRELTKLTKEASVSSVSEQVSFVSGDADVEAVEERAGLAADRVPPVYLDAWARLNHQKPEGVSEAEWRQALDGGGRFLDARGHEAAALGWRPGELFDVPGGVVWRLVASLS